MPRKEWSALKSGEGIPQVKAGAPDVGRRAPAAGSCLGPGAVGDCLHLALKGAGSCVGVWGAGWSAQLRLSLCSLGRWMAWARMRTGAPSQLLTICC